MQHRKERLENGYYYHIFSRSIAKYKVFNCTEEYSRMFDILRLYRFIDFTYRYAKFKELKIKAQRSIVSSLIKNNNLLVEIVAYCVMPTHIHLLLKQLINNGISRFLARTLNSYSRFFNIKHKRVGPLWTGRFKSVLIKNDKQLLHITRYLHLNPTSAGLVNKPEDWPYSSYREYLEPNNKNIACSFGELFDFSPVEYKKFVLDRKSYQRDLAKIKSCLIDGYTG